MGNRKNLLYVDDFGNSVKCRHVSANLVKFGFGEDQSKLTAAVTGTKPKGLEFRGVYASGKTAAGTQVSRFFAVGKVSEDIYKKGGTIKVKASFGLATEEVTLTVTSAKGESRRLFYSPPM